MTRKQLIKELKELKDIRSNRGFYDVVYSFDKKGMSIVSVISGRKPEFILKRSWDKLGMETLVRVYSYNKR